MNEAEPNLKNIMREAAEPGDSVAPVKLLDVLANVSDPIAALVNADRAQDLFGALQKEFGFIQYARITRQPLDEAGRQRWISLVRWLIGSLRRWPLADNLGAQTLVSMVAAAAFIGVSSSFWSALPDDIAQNLKLTEFLVKVVAGTAIEYGTRDPGAVPIWESEAIEAFQKADGANDWVKIAELWQPLKDAGRPNVLQTQAVRYLARFAFDRLAEAMNGVAQTPAVMILIDALTASQNIRLANASENPRLQFCCVYRVVSRGELDQPLDANDIMLLAETLSAVTKDNERWTAWMRIFNTYPVRFPAHQVALGKALAAASPEALRAYVDAIDLFPWVATNIMQNEGRRCVARCLASFADSALLEQRKLLWNIAHGRWQAWGFKDDRHGMQVMEICRSDLDYGVTAYASECMTESERNGVVDAVRQHMACLENEWHPSLTECITAWHRLLSQMQPYAHASSILANGGDPLAEAQTYWPFDKDTATYTSMMFQVRS